MNYITENKTAHSMAVAKLMYEIAVNIDGMESDEKRKELYLLGMLHDIGYMYDIFEHNKSGGLLLDSQGYKYWREVYYHGKVTDEYSSVELDILNIADLHVDYLGNNVGYNLRLKDIKDRYGEQSHNYINAKKLMWQLMNKYKNIY